MAGITRTGSRRLAFAGLLMLALAGLVAPAAAVQPGSEARTQIYAYLKYWEREDPSLPIPDPVDCPRANNQTLVNGIYRAQIVYFPDEPLRKELGSKLTGDWGVLHLGWQIINGAVATVADLGDESGKLTLIVTDKTKRLNDDVHRIFSGFSVISNPSRDYSLLKLLCTADQTTISNSESTSEIYFIHRIVIEQRESLKEKKLYSSASLGELSKVLRFYDPTLQTSALSLKNLTEVKTQIESLASVVRTKEAFEPAGYLGDSRDKLSRLKRLHAAFTTDVNNLLSALTAAEKIEATGKLTTPASPPPAPAIPPSLPSATPASEISLKPVWFLYIILPVFFGIIGWMLYQLFHRQDQADSEIEQLISFAKIFERKFKALDDRLAEVTKSQLRLDEFVRQEFERANSPETGDPEPGLMVQLRDATYEVGHIIRDTGLRDLLNRNVNLADKLEEIDQKLSEISRRLGPPPPGSLVSPVARSRGEGVPARTSPRPPLEATAPGVPRGQLPPPNRPELEVPADAFDQFREFGLLSAMTEAARRDLQASQTVREFSEKLCTRYLPANQARPTYAAVDQWLRQHTGDRAELVVPELGSRSDAAEQEIVSNRSVDRGAIGAVLEVIRPGLRVDGKIVRKADVIVSI